MPVKERVCNVAHIGCGIGESENALSLGIAFHPSVSRLCLRFFREEVPSHLQFADNISRKNNPEKNSLPPIFFHCKEHFSESARIEDVLYEKIRRTRKLEKNLELSNFTYFSLK